MFECRRFYVERRANEYACMGVRWRGEYHRFAGIVREICRIDESGGGDARLTVFEGATHFDVPTLAYFDSELNVLDWLIGNGQ